MVVERARRARHDPGAVRRELRDPPEGPVLVVEDREPRAEGHVRRTRLRAWGDEAAGASGHDRRRGILRAPPAVVRLACRRARGDARVRRPRRAGLRSGAERLLPPVALHGAEPASPRGDAADQRRGWDAGPGPGAAETRGGRGEGTGDATRFQPLNRYPAPRTVSMTSRSSFLRRYPT